MQSHPSHLVSYNSGGGNGFGILSLRIYSSHPQIIYWNCIATLGSSTCSCRAGFYLSNDKMTCIGICIIQLALSCYSCNRNVTESIHGAACSHLLHSVKLIYCIFQTLMSVQTTMETVPKSAPIPMEVTFAPVLQDTCWMLMVKRVLASDFL